MSTPKFVPQPLQGPADDQGFFMSVFRLSCNLFVVLYLILKAFMLKFVPAAFLRKSIKEDIVLITGAGSGIGRAMALKFADCGAKIVAWDINKDGLEETVKQIQSRGGEAFSYVCDVTDRAAVYDVANKIRREVGKVSIIVNNAGIVTGKRLLDIPDESIQKTFDVNVIAHYWVVKAFLPDMLSSNHGHIVSVASLAGQTGLNRLTDYCGSKFGAVGFAEALSLELHQEGYTGINTTVVCPFFINTGMFNGVSCGYFSYLDSDFVASSVVEGVLLNKDLVVLPRFFMLIVLLKYWVPTAVTKYLANVLGLNDSMKSFDAASRNKKVGSSL